MEKTVWREQKDEAGAMWPVSRSSFWRGRNLHESSLATSHTLAFKSGLLRVLHDLAVPLSSSCRQREFYDTITDPSQSFLLFLKMEARSFLPLSFPEFPISLVSTYLSSPSLVLSAELQLKDAQYLQRQASRNRALRM